METFPEYRAAATCVVQAMKDGEVFAIRNWVDSLCARTVAGIDPRQEMVWALRDAIVGNLEGEMSAHVRSLRCPVEVVSYYSAKYPLKAEFHDPTGLITPAYGMSPPAPTPLATTIAAAPLPTHSRKATAAKPTTATATAPAAAPGAY